MSEENVEIVRQAFDLAARQNEVVVVTVTAPGPGRYITDFDELPICYVSRL